VKSQASQLHQAIADGIRFIGELVFWESSEGDFCLCHREDYQSDQVTDYAALERHDQPRMAREISIYDRQGEYRYTKGELGLKNGWFFILPDADLLLQCLNNFYPSSVGIWLAQKNDCLRTINLRDKLNRQTGMYRNAKNISVDGCHELIESLCGPKNKCVKKILWQIDDETPLRDSEATAFPGYLDSTEQSIPMLCQEACNFMVAQCAKRSKKEWLVAQEK